MFSLRRAFQNGVTCSIWTSNGKDTGPKAQGAIRIIWYYSNNGHYSKIRRFLAIFASLRIALRAIRIRFERRIIYPKPLFVFASNTCSGHYSYSLRIRIPPKTIIRIRFEYLWPEALRYSYSLRITLPDIFDE